MSNQYGVADASYLAAGGGEGVARLVDDFYDLMGTDSRFSSIFNMHPENIALSRDKLTTFLCGWLGGPRLYAKKFGSMGIPAVHRHLSIGETERDLWLLCMSESVAKQPFEEDFKNYLMQQLSVPANAIVRICQQQGA